MPNGEYCGPLEVRKLPPGVTGEDLGRTRPGATRRLSKELWLAKCGVWYSKDSDGCYRWLRALSGGKPNQRGYGILVIDGKQHYAHRLAWRLFRGPIEQGLVIDHVCRVRNCVNVNHMELVTPGINVLRGFSPSGLNLTRTHCVNGHEYTPENTARRGHWRVCRECRRISKRKRRLNMRLGRALSQ